MRRFILFDGRACNGVGTDDATVLMSCNSEAEAHREKTEFGDASACYSYKEEGNKLTDEKWEWDYHAQKPNKKRRNKDEIL